MDDQHPEKSLPMRKGTFAVSASEVPPATVTRLTLYLRELTQLQQSGTETVRSNLLATRLGLTDSQIRRDLGYFGQFGKRGVGYSVRSLTKAICEILGTDQTWSVILIGMGNLGRALVGYRGFSRQGFKLVAAIDADETKVGERVGGIRVYPLLMLEEIVKKKGVELAILAVPVESAESMAERLGQAGVTGILNFAPVTVRPTNPRVNVCDVDLAIELQRLAFAVVNRNANS